MIIHLKSKVEYIDLNGNVFIKGGDSFSFQIETLIPYQISEEVDLWLYMILKEIDNKMDLRFYGFNTIDLITDFEKLMTISGVGPRMAFNLLKTIDKDSLIQVIREGDYKKIKEVPGIGDKLAKRIVLELSRVYGENDDTLAKLNEKTFTEDKTQVMESLVQMGFDKKAVFEKLQVIDNNTSKQDLLKQVLQEITKK